MESRKPGCIPEAFRLQALAAYRGRVFFVYRYQGQPVSHAYFVRNDIALDDRALNHADNGYPEYPALTVKEVLENGTELDPFALRGPVGRSIQIRRISFRSK